MKCKSTLGASGNFRLGYFPYSTTSASFLSALHTTGHNVKHDWKTAAGLSKSQGKAHSGLCHLVHWLVLVPLGIKQCDYENTLRESTVSPVAKALHGSLAGVLWGLCRTQPPRGVIPAQLSSADALERPQGIPPSLTVGGAEAILVGVVCRCHLDGGRGGEHQDVCAGGVLGGVELGRLQVQRRAAPEHRAHRHCVCGNTHHGTGVTASPPKHSSCVQGHLCPPHLLCKLTDTAEEPYLQKITLL